MFTGYKKTDLENWLEELYITKGILSPEDMEIENIASAFNIHTQLIDGCVDNAIWNDNTAVIFLNKNRTLHSLRDVFFHELCHPLRHYGNQLGIKMESFIELQEVQANHFQLYAGIPFFMLKQLELSPYENILIAQLQSIFKVSARLVRKRIAQIKRRVFQNELDQEFIKETNKVYNIYQNEPDRQIWKENANAIAQLAIARKKAKELV
jgi:Zn-dependent peptidase ImmA (M78 family)